MAPLIPTRCALLLASTLLLPVVSASDSFSDVTRGLGLLNVKGLVAALGDWNSDKYVDLFVVTEDGKEVEVYLGMEEGDGFAYVLFETRMQTVGEIVNVIPGDFNYDARMDILVQYKAGNATHSGRPVLSSTLFLQKEHVLVTAVEGPMSTDHFLAMNYYGRAFIDLVGTLYHGGETFATVIENLGCSDGSFPCIPNFACGMDQAAPGCSRSHPDGIFNGVELSHPAMSATVDFDGDCRADLALNTAGDNTTVIHFWKAEAEPESSPFHHLPESLTLAAEIGPISWYDVDSDGDMDIVAPLATTGADHTPMKYNAVIVLKNQQPGSACDGYHCCKSRPFSFPDVSTSAAIQKAVKEDRAAITYLRNGDVMEWTTTPEKQFGAGTAFPPILRLADYNNDARPDLLLNVHTTSNRSQAQLWGGAGDCVFVPVGSGHDSSLLEVRSVFAAFFFDFYEDGVNDIIVSSVNRTSGRTYLTALSNGVFQTSHLFFKALGTNGVCSESCHGGIDPYGVNMPGVVHKFFYKVPETFSTRDAYMMGTQLTQSSHLSLHRPYCSWGLGVTNSYIEVYFCGVHVRGHGDANMNWLALLPNSEVIVLTHPLDHPKKWLLELFISPAKYLKWVIITVCVTLFLLAVPITILHYQELKADAEERRSAPLMPM
eukprot:Sspe_Gene.53086::Locus_29365_Transcript_2_2_Confidence_0.800_Length_2260::g.53086::m.53086/K17257/ITFG1; integrin alpha FG-GAP repeat containing protein 1